MVTDAASPTDRYFPRRRAPSGRDLLVFGCLLALFVQLLAAFLLYRAVPVVVAQGVWLAGMCLVLLYAAFPPVRRPLHAAFVSLTRPLGWLFSHALAAAAWYLVVTPVGLAARLLGYDPLGRPAASQSTYWVRRPAPPSLRRYFRQY